jgi:small subunit ribosomal protein S9
MTVASDKKEYLSAVGRRKSAVATVRLYRAPKLAFSINGRELEKYFGTAELRRVASEAFTKAKISRVYKVVAVIKGGGLAAQAEALRHGISRALLTGEPELRKKLKRAGFLKRDPRSKERRKFGLKKARKAPQWSKR